MRATWHRERIRADRTASACHCRPLRAFCSHVERNQRHHSVNGNVALCNVKFGEFTEYLNLGPAGAYKIEVLPTGSTTVAITQDLTLAAGDYTVLAVGGANSQDLALLALPDNNTAPAADRAKVRVIHAAPFAAGAGTAVSIRDENNAVVGGLGNVSFKTASGYLEVPAGVWI